MKNQHLIFLAILLVLQVGLFGAPQKTAAEVLIAAEENASLRILARQAAASKQLPTSLLLANGTFIEALAVEDGSPVYVIMPNPAHPFQSAETAFYQDLQHNYDVHNAKLTYAYRPKAPKLTGAKSTATDMLFIVESSNDFVIALDAATGDLINAQFFALGGGVLSTPIDINPTARGTFTVSDQAGDLVQDFDISGNFLGTFAPLGGVNTAILDNIRGHDYRANGNLVVTVASGSNADAVAEFDQSGAYIGNFIANGAGGMGSPFDLIFRDNDVLVVAINSNNVVRYDLDGNFLDIFTGGIDFGEQAFEMSNSDVAVANFTGTNGVSIYDATGGFLRNLSGVTGIRGVHELPSGNLVVTNGGGVYEINGTTGALVRQMVVGVSARFVSLYSPTPAGPALATSPGTLDFGDIDFGDTATDSIYAISFGSDTLQLDSTVSTNAVFTLTTGSATLPSGDSLLIHVNFTPDSVGSFDEYLVFYHNGPSSPDSVAVSGNGLGQPELTLTPTDLNMGMVNGGDTLTAFVNAANTGNATLVLDSIRIDNSLFSSDQTGSLILTPDNATDILVTFVADTTQSLQIGNMLFYSNQATSPDTVLLTADVITGFISDVGSTPDKFHLEQNFPNPFNPRTTISFQLPMTSVVQLEIFNMLGQRIVTAHKDATLQAGLHKFVWDGKDAVGNQIPSGIYFYRLKTDQGFMQIRKMMLIK